jgi:uncharacterized protein YecA (UPF0149 family)
MLFIPMGLTDNTKQRSTVNARGTLRNYSFQRGKEVNILKSWKFVTQNGAGLIHMKWGVSSRKKTSFVLSKTYKTAQLQYERNINVCV